MTSPTDVPGSPRRAAIVGLGLIGGSIGLGLRRLGWHVTGSDLSEETAATALALGAIDEVGSDASAEVTFIATPVGAVRDVARAALAAGPGIVTDVGGVKASVVSSIEEPRFIGGHPMAGSENEGVAAADPDLFSGAAWVLTPTAATDPDGYALLHATVSALGADVVAIPPEQHDAIVAVVSHVPHLTAAALMAIAASHASQHGSVLRLAAGGFRDMTRISAGQTAIWPDVVADNRPAIVSVLDELVTELQRLRRIVDEGDRAEIVASLDRARRARLALPARAAQRAGVAAEVRVPVPNREGVIADVATLAAELGVNIESMETADATDQERGLIVMVVDLAASQRLRDALIAKGYRPTVQELG
jgi:prephenate dehydrogenase